MNYVEAHSGALLLNMERVLVLVGGVPCVASGPTLALCNGPWESAFARASCTRVHVVARWPGVRVAARTRWPLRSALLTSFLATRC